MDSRSRTFFQIGLDAFLPFNDAPSYLSGKIVASARDGIRIAGKARNQLVGWHKMGLRSPTLSPHSFTFSVDAKPNLPLGAYSIGIHAEPHNRPSINISHFVRSSTSLVVPNIEENLFSGWSWNLEGERSQQGLMGSWAPINRHHNLAVSYDAERKELSCSFNGFLLHEITSDLGPFHLAMRFESVGVERDFDIEFENLSYFSYDLDRRNVLPLNAWDPQYAPVFVSYSHADKETVRPIASALQTAGVRVIGDWKFRIGDSLVDRISSGIERAGYLIVMLSPASVGSNWVQRELQIAIDSELARRNVKVLPVILESCDIPAFLRGKVWAKSDDQDLIEILLRAIRSLGSW